MYNIFSFVCTDENIERRYRRPVTDRNQGTETICSDSGTCRQNFSNLQRKNSLKDSTWKIDLQSNTGRSKTHSSSHTASAIAPISIQKTVNMQRTRLESIFKRNLFDINYITLNAFSIFPYSYLP